LKAAQELSEQLLEDSDDRDEFFAQREEEEYERRNPYRSRGLSPSDFI
jgi:hypothetical protein